jgi:nitrite reductase (NADH) small subunit
MMKNLATWQSICTVDDLIANAGVCALLEDPADKQIAIFSVPHLAEQVFVVDNYDPIGKANVLYRGIVGCSDGEPVISSPLYKQQFSLTDGRCLQENISIKTYITRIQDNKIQLLIE